MPRPTKRMDNIVVFPGADYTAEEVEFLKEVDKWKRVNRRQFPSHVELLRLLISLGYTKNKEPPK